jgi:hypothetical protein
MEDWRTELDSRRMWRFILGAMGSLLKNKEAGLWRQKLTSLLPKIKRSWSYTFRSKPRFILATVQ